ncbi:1,4-alpha-glucan branching protein GlgB [Rhodocyclus tenuis]|uniref:1,4-alpha-glucan branching enzyme GlgB n=1 Tax=Rhodocyclus tenuis TaxID=1066 RepID=A0A840GC27_RHOTE|nr:1,4-alpha-glucan branching protein GlgB [Rhodocyclus tenuis]MBB4248430.1 1,4-alpha-glucan branching enzyme [Rhodocyclus tenuis]
MNPITAHRAEIAPSADDLYLYNEGRNTQAYGMLGAHVQDSGGVVFRVWAPNAARVSVVGEFNGWDGNADPLASLGASGVWAGVVGHATPGQLYRFEIFTAEGYRLVKTDPYARECELRPGNASRIAAPGDYLWGDAQWLQERAACDWLHAPMSVYEVHPGSWMRHPDGRLYNWRELAASLVPYARDKGFTHIELLPVTEHPLDESWGYQTTGYFAPSSRFGSPADLKFFIDASHQAGLGVLLDWVPGHFPGDDWALADFDGSALYEHADPRLGLHADWGTRIFNYGRHEVKSFLLSSAHWWLSEYHFDGLRVDAVASMLYLDYSRQPGQWLPNRFGGRENLDAIQFLRELNAMVHGDFPGALTLAEESTAWPMVSRPVWLGGLGFSMKWSMGWMNDSLRYFARDPLYRRWHHNELTFGQMYAYSENFVLPLSHDEVVHGKGSLIGKMPGDDWQRFANLRLLLAWQMTTPGKKLLFMGCEFGQWREWSEQRELDWGLLADGRHAGVQGLVRDLNQLYRAQPALHELDFEPAGFEWIDCHDAEHSVLSWLRRARDGRHVVVVCNFTPQLRQGYRIGVPQTGTYREVFNSDSAHYGGSNAGNGGAVNAYPGEWMRLPASVDLTLPPLACVVLALD